MEKRLKFGTPKIESGSGVDGFTVRFPFWMIETAFLGKPEWKAKTELHTIVTSISKLCVTQWRLETPDEIVKLLFEFGTRFVIERLKLNQVPNHGDVEMPMITSRTHPETERPFDLSKIREPSGASLLVNIDEIECSGRNIGFKAT